MEEKTDYSGEANYEKFTFELPTDSSEVRAKMKTRLRLSQLLDYIAFGHYCFPILLPYFIPLLSD